MGAASGLHHGVHGLLATGALCRLTMGAAVCAGLFSYFLLLGALLSDRGKRGDETLVVDRNNLLPRRSEYFMEEKDEWRSLSSSIRFIRTDTLEHKETLFALSSDDREWRIVAPAQPSSKQRRSARSIRSDSSSMSNEEDLNCDQISELIPSMSFLAAGWTKAVYKAKMTTSGGDQRTVAVKTVDLTGQDMSRCLEERRKDGAPHQGDADGDGDADVDWCYQRAARKLIKEIAVLKLLMEHQNVVKVLGYCVPKRIDSRTPERRVSIVTELGEPVNLIKLLQMSWEERLRIVLAIARLTDYLSRHPTGNSLVMNDMRRQQFVLSTDGDLKLVDVDDVGLEEPECKDDRDCRRYLNQILGEEASNSTLTCNMEKKVCSGANELRNIFNAARHFTTFLLPYGAPPQLQSRVDELVDSFRSRSLPASRLRQLTESLVQAYASGSYLSKVDIENETAASRDFVAWPDSDLPGQFDYSCESSQTQMGCSLSVANLAEARQLCSAQAACRAFVWMNDKTWTGRTIVHFKNDVRSPTHRPNATLYVKLSR